MLSATEAKVAAFMAVFDHGATTRLFYQPRRRRRHPAHELNNRPVTHCRSSRPMPTPRLRNRVEYDAATGSSQSREPRILEREGDFHRPRKRD